MKNCWVHKTCFLFLRPLLKKAPYSTLTVSQCFFLSLCKCAKLPFSAISLQNVARFAYYNLALISTITRGGVHITPVTLAQRLRSNLACKFQISCFSHNFAIYWIIVSFFLNKLVLMLTIIKWYVTCYTHLHASKVKVTLRGKRSNLALSQTAWSYRLRHYFAIYWRIW